MLNAAEQNARNVRPMMSFAMLSGLRRRMPPRDAYAPACVGSTAILHHNNNTQPTPAFQGEAAPAAGATRAGAPL
jgi:hypothetical protein